MEQFIFAMKQQNIPKYAIQLIENSEEWQIKFKYFNDDDIKQMIRFYPNFYMNVLKPLNKTTINELNILKDKFNSLYMNDNMKL